MGWESFMCLDDSDFKHGTTFGSGNTSTHSENIHTIKCQPYFFKYGQKTINLYVTLIIL